MQPVSRRARVRKSSTNFPDPRDERKHTAAVSVTITRRSASRGAPTGQPQGRTALSGDGSHCGQCDRGTARGPRRSVDINSRLSPYLRLAPLCRPTPPRAHSLSSADRWHHVGLWIFPFLLVLYPKRERQPVSAKRALAYLVHLLPRLEDNHFAGHGKKGCRSERGCAQFSGGAGHGR